MDALIDAINSDNSLSEQQKRAYKIGFLLQVKWCQRWFGISLISLIITILLGLLIWKPLWILSIIFLITGLWFSNKLTILVGSPASKKIDSETEKLGGEQVVTKANFCKELAKAAGTSKEFQEAFDKLIK